MKDYMNGRLTIEVMDAETEKTSRINLGDLVEHPGVDQSKEVKTDVSEAPMTQLTYTQSYIVL